MSERDDMKLPASLDVHAIASTSADAPGLIGIKGDERTCDWAPSRFKLDTIGALCRLVRDGGLVMTFHGQPIEEGELRELATTMAVQRIAGALLTPETKEP